MNYEKGWEIRSVQVGFVVLYDTDSHTQIGVEYFPNQWTRCPIICFFGWNIL